MGDWIQRASMPTPRHDLQAVAVGGEIYAISGAGDLTVHAVEIYDVASDTWRQGPPIPTKRGWFGAAMVDARIYAIGGKAVRSDEEIERTGDDYSFNIRDSVEVLDLGTQTWSTTESLTRPRAGLVATACRGRVYAIAGNSMNTEPDRERTFLDRVEVYDPQTGHWSPGVPVPVPVQGPGVVTADEKIYVATGIGGDDGQPQTDFHRFDPETEEWSRLAPVPTPRCDPGALALDGKIYLFGGWGGERPYHTVVEVYDIASDTWSAGVPLPERKAWMATAAVGGRVFVMGGARAKEGGGYRWIDDLHELVR